VGCNDLAAPPQMNSACQQRASVVADGAGESMGGRQSSSIPTFESTASTGSRRRLCQCSRTGDESMVPCKKVGIICEQVPLWHLIKRQFVRQPVRLRIAPPAGEHRAAGDKSGVRRRGERL